MENLTFPEAIEFLANRFSIPIRYADNATGKSNSYRKSIKSDLYEVQELAMTWFAEQFYLKKMKVRLHMTTGLPSENSPSKMRVNLELDTLQWTDLH